MKRKGFLQTACTLAAMLLLAAACTPNDCDGSQGEPLPEGKYPLTFTATGLQATPQTRAATADGQWTTGDEVAIQVKGVKDGVKKYTPTSISNNAATATLQAATGETPFYWESTSDINVSAWYLGTGYSATPPTDASWSWSVQSNQNENEGYQKSDFLYAPAKSFAFKPQTGADNSLTFYHQTAKVIINIRSEGILTDASKIASVVIGNNNNIALKGTYTAPTGNGTAGTWNPATDGKGTITPKTLTSPNTGVSFGSGSSTETALASYEALVIPQTVTTGENFIGITVDGITYYYKAETGKNELKAGYVHTYNITVKGEKLEVTVSNSSMNWGTGTSGSGSVEFPTLITLGSEAVSISDNGKYFLTGTGSGAVTINGSPTVTLQDVTLTASNSAPLLITGGNPTIIIKGTTKLEATADYCGGIELRGQNTNVIIEGDGKLEIKTKSEAAGIGSGRQQDNMICGDIYIKDITAEITSSAGAGIGTAKEGSCGNIKIENAKIKIAAGGWAAAIGIGYLGYWSESKCGNIEITKSNLNLTVSSNGIGYYQAAIGCTSSQYGGGTCGNVTITLMENQTKDSFLNKLSVPNESGKKIGQGYAFDKYVGKIGTITWKDANGNVIETESAQPAS